MKTTLSHILVAAVGVLYVSGCASIKETYVPTTVGPASDAIAAQGLQLRISPKSEVAVKGEAIEFDVMLTNVGQAPVMLPRRPEILLVWTYANGTRDNFLRDVPASKYFDHHDVTELAPGASMELSIPVKTYYFEKLGITEFRAILETPRNTNPTLGNVWQGRLVSNRYGVMVTKTRDYAALITANSLASIH